MRKSSDAGRLPTLALLLSATLWGLSWWPLRQLNQAGVGGLLLAVSVYGLAGLPGLWMLRRQWPDWRGERGFMLLLALLGGYAHLSFLLAMIYGDVARVIMLFFLAPAWSVLGGKYWLGETVGRRRWIATGLALSGAFLLVGAEDAAWQDRVSATDWLALSSGMAFAAGNLLNRRMQAAPIASKTFAVFLGCAVLAGGLAAFQPVAAPPSSLYAWLGLAVYALAWLLPANLASSYGLTHLPAGRAALLLLVELPVTVVSAMLLGAEILEPNELAGGLLILTATALDRQPDEV
jgi:drug/metabolite transporter (DMT)-like permease